MLANRGRATFEQLKEACERALDIYPLGNRTIEQDIHKMRHDNGLGFYAPIQFDRHTKEYYYEEPDYSIDERSLTDEEITSLVFASQLLNQFKDMEIFQTFQGTVQRLIDVVEVFAEDTHNTLKDKVEFEHMPKLQGSEYLESILQSLSQKIVLEIKYKSFYSKTANTHIIHPFYLKEFRNRWYMVGYNERYKGIRTYSLDRIITLEQLADHPFTDTEFDPKEHYKHIVGVTTPERDPTEIKLAFTKEQAKYLKTQPLHESQELVEESDDRVVFKYLVVPTFEFTSQILGWSDEVEVLEPREYRKKVIGLLKASLGQYEKY